METIKKALKIIFITIGSIICIWLILSYLDVNAHNGPFDQNFASWNFWVMLLKYFEGRM